MQPAWAPWNAASQLTTGGCAGGLYALAARAHGGSPETCIGSDCFGTTFAVAAVLAALAALLSLWLAARSRRLYQRPLRLSQTSSMRR